LVDVARQHVNGSVVVDFNHSHETFNIQWFILFKPCQNHWGVGRSDTIEGQMLKESHTYEKCPT
jgi:hypothetical protein